MAYTGTTFITFPNGDTVDVAQTAMTVSGTKLTLNKSGLPHYSFTFSSAADAANYISIIASVVSAFNYSPITFWDWSTDGMNWQSGNIPVNASPIFIQAFGQNLQATASATLMDSSGRTFDLPLISATANVVEIGPFAAPGQNAPAIGNAKLTLLAVSGTQVASDTVVIGPAAVMVWTPASETSLYEWLKADSISQSQGSTVTDWPASQGFDMTAASPTFQTNVQNGLPIVRFSAADSDNGEIGSFYIPSLPFTLAFLFRNNGSSPTDILMESSSGFFELTDQAGSLIMNFGGTAQNIATTDNRFHLLVIVCNGASTTYAMDGALLQPVSANPGSPAPQDLFIASQAHGGANYASVDIGEIAFWKSDGTTFYDDLVQYMANRWGV